MRARATEIEGLTKRPRLFIPPEYTYKQQLPNEKILAYICPCWDRLMRVRWWIVFARVKPNDGEETRCVFTIESHLSEGELVGAIHKELHEALEDENDR